MTGLKIVLGLLACVLHASAYETATGGDSYIIDGHNASQHQFPWIVSLRTVATNRHVCGGFILGDRWVGTSAECIRRASLQSQTVVVASGAHTRTDGNIHHVIRIIRHPRFSHISMTFDFALLQTANKIPITPQGPVRAIKCATGPVVEDDASVITAGWGIIKYPRRGKQNYPSVLQWKPTRTISRSECQRKMGLDCAPMIRVDNICTLSADATGACIGDFGGLLVDEGGTCIGIASWNRGCVRDYPDVYTKLWSVIAFIRQATKNSIPNLPPDTSRQFNFNSIQLSP